MEMDAALKEGGYRPKPSELAGIDHDLRAAQEGRLVADEEVRWVFARHRPA
jgi:predicted transcriptional regulator